MKRPLPRLLHVGTVVLTASACLLMAGCGGDALEDFDPAPDQVQFQETAEVIQNPERGLYKALTNLLETTAQATQSECELAMVQGYSIVYVPVILPVQPSLTTRFAQSKSTVERIDDGLGAIRTSCKTKVAVRFYYIENDEDMTFCPNGNTPYKCTDPPAALIISHLDQLKPTLEKYSDIIFALKAGLIGPWGEWHSSNLAIDHLQRKSIAEKLLQVVPSSRMIQIRTPKLRYAVITGSTGDVVGSTAIGNPAGPTAFDGSMAARTGHHNDCFLCSPDDRNTYSPGPQGEVEKNYIADDTRYAPMGGETGGQTSAYDAETDSNPGAFGLRAQRELAKLHWTYLNGGWNEEVRYKLGARDAGATSHPPNYGLAENYVNHPSHVPDSPWKRLIDKLGYRFVVESAGWSPRVELGSSGNFVFFFFTFRIKNLGYAALFNERPVWVVLHNVSRSYPFKLDIDPRRWQPSDTHPDDVVNTVDVVHSTNIFTFKLPNDIPAGKYTVSLWLPDAAPTLKDDPAYAVRFAHDGQWWDAVRGYNVLKVDGVEIVK